MDPAWLTPEEVEDYWALGVPIEAIYVPDEQLRQAVADKRVEETSSWSSMGTAETYWQRVDYGLSRASAVAWPPGYECDKQGYNHDDRDVYGCLWKPFYSRQESAAIRHVPASETARVLAACARVLGAFEEAWVREREQERAERATYIALLYAPGPVDLIALDEWLAFRTNKSEAHLVAGVRARWLRGNIGELLEAVTESAGRFGFREGRDRKPPMERDAARHVLVRLMVGLARGRGWRGVEIASNEGAFVFESSMLAVVRGPRDSKAPIEECRRCRVTASPPVDTLEPVDDALAFCTKCRTFYAIEAGVAVRLPLGEGGARLAKANNPKHAKWAKRRWKQVGDELAALAALVSDPTVPRDHLWEYARASLLDGFGYGGLISRALARHPDPEVRAQTIATITKAAAAGNVGAQRYLEWYPVDRILEGLRRSQALGPK